MCVCACACGMCMVCARVCMCARCVHDMCGCVCVCVSAFALQETGSHNLFIPCMICRPNLSNLQLFGLCGGNTIYTMACKLGISSKIHIVCSKKNMIYPVPGIGISLSKN